MAYHVASAITSTTNTRASQSTSFTTTPAGSRPARPPAATPEAILPRVLGSRRHRRAAWRRIRTAHRPFGEPLAAFGEKPPAEIAGRPVDPENRGRRAARR